MIVAMVAPRRRLSIPITRACFESARPRLAGCVKDFCTPFLRRAAARREGLPGAGSAPCSGSLGSSASGSVPPSSTWMAARPRLVMRSASGPLSSSRRQTGSEPRAWISSVNPSVKSLPTTLWAAPPFRFAASSIQRSSRCEAADRSTSWVSVSFMGSSVRLATALRAVTTKAPQWRESRRGRIPERGHATSSGEPHYRSARTEMPVLSGIILLLVSRRMDHGMILALGPARARQSLHYQSLLGFGALLAERTPDYESGGQEFESLRARHFGTKLVTPKPAVFALEAATSVRRSTLFDPKMRTSFVSTSTRWRVRGDGRGDSRHLRCA